MPVCIDLERAKRLRSKVSLYIYVVRRDYVNTLRERAERIPVLLSICWFDCTNPSCWPGCHILTNSCLYYHEPTCNLAVDSTQNTFTDPRVGLSRWQLVGRSGHVHNIYKLDYAYSKTEPARTQCDDDDHFSVDIKTRSQHRNWTVL